LTKVGGEGRVDAGSVESALVAGHGGRVRAPVTPDSWCGGVVGGRSLGWITLNVHVKGSAQSGVVAVGRTFADIVRVERVEANVRAGRDGCVQVFEHLLVDLTVSRAGNLRRRGIGLRLEERVGLESGNGVWGD